MTLNKVQKIEGSSKIEGTIKSPASKSYAQRAAAAALLASGRSTLLNVDLSNDTAAALDVARLLGAKVTQIDETTYQIDGGLNPISDTICIGESGLSTRMFTPIVALWNKPLTITGRGSIMNRTIQMMEAPLNELGVKTTSNGGYLPLTVEGPIVNTRATVDGSISSQFLTGLLMALPMAQHDTMLSVNNLTSIPYIDMTLDLLANFGITITHTNYELFDIKGGQHYTPQNYNVEGDWSGVSCLLVAGAVAGAVKMTNLNINSSQADVAILDALRMAGATVQCVGNSVTVSSGKLLAFEFDATQCPDLFPALAALAANCRGTTTIKGTTRLAHKESDRAATIKSEFAKTGIEIDIQTPNVMRITGGKINGATVSSHNDHRIAMAMATAGLTCSGTMVVEDAEAVEKSYPQFWNDLGSLMKR